MKRIIIFLLILLFQGSIFAAEADFHGDLLSAMCETDPRMRAGRIIDALANSSDSKCDRAALAVLADDLANGALDNSLISKLNSLLKKYPADWKVAKLAADAAQLSGIYSETLISDIQKFLFDQDLAAIPEKDQSALNSLIYVANHPFRKAKDQKGSLKFFNQLVNKNPRSALLLRAAAAIQINNCFHVRNTAPNFPNYKKLSTNDIWKSSLNSIAEKIENAEVKNALEADAVVTAAFMLRHPKMADLLKKYSAVYSEHDWSTISALIANEVKNPELFITEKNVMRNFFGYITLKDYPAARKLIRGFNENIRKNLDIILKSAQDRHHEVAASAHSDSFKLNNFFTESMHALITSIHIAKDRKAVAKVMKSVVEDIENNNGKNSSFLICNAIGYVAADLNMSLSDAEKLIRRAVAILPEESSFRDSLAWVLFRQGRFREAEKEADAALDNRTAEYSSAVLLLHAAQIKFSCGRPVEARELLEKAKELYQPDKKECYEYDIEIQKNLEKLLK